jgi:hypothetical protein
MLMQMNHVYTLNDFRDITFGGFDIKLPDKTIEIITVLAEQVGSPTYIKTPVFAKREIPVIKEPIFKKKRRANQGMESVCDEDWESLRTFQATKIEQKVGLDAQFDLIRSSLNKITEKTYDDQTNKICDILDQIQSGEQDMLRVGNAIFEIASTNRFYSKLYADLYTMLIHKYEIMHSIFETNLNAFLELFTKIEYVSAEEDYDAFCKNNSNNEKRKALSMFFVNLSATKIITDAKIIEFASNLLKQVMQLIHEENKKNEVDEMIENIALLYNKDIFAKSTSQVITGQTFVETIEELAKSKSKNFQSLSNKAIFKCMDMVDM